MIFMPVSLPAQAPHAAFPDASATRPAAKRENQSAALYGGPA